MEIIILAIVAIIFNLITKGKNPPTNNKNKPFMEKPLNQPKKKLEDYAREVYTDVQKQFSPVEEHTRGDRAGHRNERQPDKINKPRSEIGSAEIGSSEIGRGVPSPKRPGRLSVHQTTASVVEKKAEKTTLIPTTSNELIQAIVFSEILAPPKSKR